MKKLANGLDKCLDVLLIVLLLATIVIVTSQIALRYLLSNPLPWADEITRYLFVYLVFVGAGWGIRYSVHVSIDSVLKLLPASLQAIGDFISRLIVGIFLVGLLYFGTMLSLGNMSQQSPALGMPIGLVYAAIPLGALVGIIFVIAPKRQLDETVAV